MTDPCPTTEFTPAELVARVYPTRADELAPGACAHCGATGCLGLLTGVAGLHCAICAHDRAGRDRQVWARNSAELTAFFKTAHEDAHQVAAGGAR